MTTYRTDTTQEALESPLGKALIWMTAQRQRSTPRRTVAVYALTALGIGLLLAAASTWTYHDGSRDYLSPAATGVLLAAAWMSPTWERLWLAALSLAWLGSWVVPILWGALWSWYF